MRSRSTLLIVAVACLLSQIAQLGRSQERRAIRPVGLTPAEQRLFNALDDVATLEFLETPLADVVEFLKDAHDIPIQVDTKALAEENLTTDMPITQNLKGITLRSALQIMLREEALTYAVSDEVVLITTPLAAAMRPSVRVYQVSHLLPGDAADANELIQAIQLAVARPAADGGEPSIAALGPLLIVRDTEEGQFAVQRLLSQLADGLGRGQEPPKTLEPRGRGEPREKTPPHPGENTEPRDPFAPPAAGQSTPEDPFGAGVAPQP